MKNERLKKKNEDEGRTRELNLFKKHIWSQLSKSTKKKLIKRFSLKKVKSFSSLVKAFKTPLIPKAFCVAAVRYIENPSKEVFMLIDRNFDTESYQELITYDEDHWGARRQEREYIGIFEDTNAKVTEEEKRYAEFLLRCSISLNKEEKLRVIKSSKNLSRFQVTSLIKVWEEELEKWFSMSYEQQKNDICKLVEKAEKEWEEIITMNPLQIQKIPIDKEGVYTPMGMYQLLREYIKGQDEALKSVATSFYYHKRRALALKKNAKSPYIGRIEPIFITGPTGSGKSFLIKKASYLIDLPFVHVDASSLVSSGIKGYNIIDALKDLIRKSDYKKSIAQTGVIFFDEVDKLLLHHDGASILSQLLRVIEGSLVSLVLNNTQEEIEFKDIKQIDTTQMLFFLGGSFEMEKVRSSGFISNDNQDFIVKKEDMEQYRIPKELLGRVEEVIFLRKLSKEALFEIVTNAKESPLLKYKQMLMMDGKPFSYDEKLIEKIVDEAYKSNYGARALNSLLKEYFRDLLFDMPQDCL
jgi:ATP-dependent Clp protease ATP-binding subunit ClpX